MLQLESVSKEYKLRQRRVSGLEAVTLHIDKGEYVAIVGASGSGKSTLLLILGGMLTPTGGSYLLNGQSIYDLSSDRRAAVRRKSIGFVFQTFNLVPYLSALENVEIPLMLSGLAASEHRRKASELLARVGLADRMEHKPSELSIGQQQRVALARMLANDPELVLADEPTGNLDPENSANILNFLQELHAEGRTIVMVTHDPDAARRTTRTLHLAEGRLVPAADSISG